MLKSQLADRLAYKLLDIKKIEDVARYVNYVIDSLSETLANHGRIEIRGFGSFELRYRAPHRAHNPRTGKFVVSQGRYRAHFKPGKELRKLVNK